MKIKYDILNDYDPKENLPAYIFPTIDLLEDANLVFPIHKVIEIKEKLISILQANNIDVWSLDATVGYTNTLYEITPLKGLRLDQLKNLYADLSFNLSTPNISIEPIFDKTTIGLVVPNKEHIILPIKSVIDSDEFSKTHYELPLIIGQTLTHKNIIVDLSEKKHILISGATGQGKSVLLNVIIASLLYKKHPAELKFVLFDPLRIELNLYSTIEKHFLAKLAYGETNVVSDIQDVIETLRSLTYEVDKRFEMLLKANVRNIKEYNAMFRKRELNPSKGHRFMTYIVVIMDKYCDIATSEGETYIRRLVKNAHLVGIHLILSIQCPSQDIIGEDVKNNFPVHIAFRAVSRQDSKIMLDDEGAERLCGNGDAIYKDELSKIRLQVPFISTDEVKKIIRHIGRQQGYDYAYLLPLPDDSPLLKYSLNDLNMPDGFV